jgi:hypothetical protein
MSQTAVRDTPRTAPRIAQRDARPRRENAHSHDREWRGFGFSPPPLTAKDLGSID